MYLYVNIKSDTRVQDEIYKSGLMTQFKKKYILMVYREPVYS